MTGRILFEYGDGRFRRRRIRVRIERRAGANQVLVIEEGTAEGALEEIVGENVFLRETGDEGRMAFALAPGSPSRPYLLGVVEQLAAQISIQNIKTPKMPKLEILG